MISAKVARRVKRPSAAQSARLAVGLALFAVAVSLLAMVVGIAAHFRRIPEPVLQFEIKGNRFIPLPSIRALRCPEDCV
jgi:hypothetical protein